MAAKIQLDSKGRKIAQLAHTAACEGDEHRTAQQRLDCGLATCLRNGHEGTFQADFLRQCGAREPRA